MGACCGKSPDKGGSVSHGTEGSLLDTGLPRHKEWASTTPVGVEELKRQREVFWDTQPAYGGKQEIWDALKSVLPLPAQDEALTIAILKAAEISFPKGTWAEIYDSTGFKYELPPYAISDPTNLQR
eukprot:TRINITY_DN16189_c0_g1_i1.p1 TRINITY_DN16189_c0_g1~~TRINITY_DN16189_c0_g1_i1.p1  ORF type:complete len:126 (+),score=30.28 TRINITY_DN16189_c0_g1_i1:69-446(+)